MRQGLYQMVTLPQGRGQGWKVKLGSVMVAMRMEAVVRGWLIEAVGWSWSLPLI